MTSILVAALNRERYAKTGDMEIASRISSYEMAFRMQMSTPELLDLSKEPAQHSRLVWSRIRRPRGPLGRTACWPAAWWSGACGS